MKETIGNLEGYAFRVLQSRFEIWICIYPTRILFHPLWYQLATLFVLAMLSAPVLGLLLILQLASKHGLIKQICWWCDSKVYWRLAQVCYNKVLLWFAANAGLNSLDHSPMEVNDEKEPSSFPLRTAFWLGLAWGPWDISKNQLHYWPLSAVHSVKHVRLPVTLDVRNWTSEQLTELLWFRVWLPDAIPCPVPKNQNVSWKTCAAGGFFREITGS